MIPPYQKVLKRTLDLLFTILALVMLSPLFLAIALWVLLDSGRPVLFVQERVGLNGRIFRCYKFRTMITGASMVFNTDGSTRVLEKDPRVTRVGRLLRKFSLDELPQLFNVFLGQMSLVGPRPDLPFNWEKYDDRQRLRFTVKPGITGLAQINGRTSLTINEKIAYDLEYVDRYSLLLDMKILLQTFRVIISGSNVYN